MMVTACAEHPEEDATNGCALCTCEECGLPEQNHTREQCFTELLRKFRAADRTLTELQKREPSHVFQPVQHTSPCRVPGCINDARDEEGFRPPRGAMPGDGRALAQDTPFERQKSADAMCWRLVAIRLLLAQKVIARYEKDRDSELESFFDFCVQLAKG